MRSRSSRLLLLVALCAGCRNADVPPGAAVYYRTAPLSAARREAFERELSDSAGLAIASVDSRGAPEQSSRGIVALERGHDGPAERARALAWLRARPEVEAAGEDSTTIFR
jgi:hypothetical protein